jgi:hypothetical protein
MTKKEISNRVLKDGKALALSSFSWGETTKTFSSDVDGLVLDFKGIDGVTFKTGYNCTFKTGYNCTFKTGLRCTFNTGSDCTFKTGSRCTFNVFEFGYFNTTLENKSNVLVLRDSENRKIVDFSDLSPSMFYKLHVSEDHVVRDSIEVRNTDGDIMVVDKSTSMNGFTIHETSYITDYFNEEATEDERTCQFVAERDGITAHGESVKGAIRDVMFKIDSKVDKSKHVERIKSAGFLTGNDYRLLSGACFYGTNKFIEEHPWKGTKLSWDSEVPLGELRSLVAGSYGCDKVCELLGV